MLLAALHAGHYFSTEGPLLRSLQQAGNALRVECSPAYAISLSGGGDRWLSSAMRTAQVDQPLVAAEFDLAPFQGSFCRVVVLDGAGRRAWSNPIWP